MPLRDYQVKLLEDLRASVASGHKRPVAVLPTGGGKGDLAVEIAMNAIGFGQRVLFTVHRGAIVEQITERAQKAGIHVDTLSASAKGRYTGKAPLTCSTVQTLTRRGLFPPADLLLVDECHRFPTSQFSKVVEHYKLCIGFTATPARDNGGGLGDIFDDLISGPDVPTLVAGGYLVRAEVLAPPRPLGAGEIAVKPVQAYVEHTPGQRCLVYAPHIAAAREYAEDFERYGVKCSVVTGESGIDARHKAIRFLKDGSRPIIINCGVYTEGVDLPCVTVVILARGCGSCSLYLQICGRALRPFPGKEKATIIDLRGVTHVHGAPDLRREYTLDKGVSSAGEMQFQFCKICSAPVPCGVPEHMEGNPVAMPNVMGVALEKYAGKRLETDEERAESLARYFIQARINRRSEGWVFNKYQAIYGIGPTAKVIRMARSK